jgi:hypothetical protein
MSNVKIFICAHKEVSLPQHPYFLPVQAGASLHEPIPGYQPDSDGDNISVKNPHFCELTCHYWAWKNLKNVDIIGLNHYRRYFDFQKKCPQFSADKRFTSTEAFLSRPYHFPDLDKLLQKYDIILPITRHWRVSNTQQYYDYHIAKDWEMLRQIIKERSPQYSPAFEKTMDHSNKSAGYNMFITHWKNFNAYSEWLFDILFEVERRVPPIADSIQSRIYGYMSERLINVFCEHHHLRIKHIPLIMPLDDYHEGLNISDLHAIYRRLSNDLIYKNSER